MRKQSIIKSCETCKKPFETSRTKQDRRFCSHECYAKSLMTYVTKACEQCGKPFIINLAKKGTRRFCSRACNTKNKTHRITKICETCNKSFEVTPVFEDRRFCSETCYGQSKVTRATKICDNCGASFEVNQARKEKARYCSFACQMAVQNKKVKLNCQYCGEPFYTKPSDVNVRRTCSRSCLAKLKIQEGRTPAQGHKVTEAERQKISTTLSQYHQENPTKHPWYIDGSYVQGVLRRGPSWETQRKAARERDNHTCQVCGKTKEQEGKNLAVHHIKPYRLFANSIEANALENLLTVCQSCHMKLEHAKIELPHYRTLPTLPDVLA